MPEYFTLEELKALPDLDAARYDDEMMERAAAYIEGVIERAVGTSFVARTFTKTLRESDADTLLGSPYVLSVASVVIADAAAPSSFAVEGFSSVGLSRSWPNTGRHVTVTYTSGYSDTPPADIKEAALQGTRARLLDTAGNAKVNDRTASVTNDAGGTTSYVLAGVDRPTGYPEVDAVILGWRKRLFGLGFA